MVTESATPAPPRWDADRTDASTFVRVRYEVPLPNIARITLARPEAANAQDYLMLYELNAALDRAALDDKISVIIVAADGKHFSSGHDLRNLSPSMDDFPTVGTAANYDADGSEGLMDREREIYLTYCKRWRDIPKPTIAQVHGSVIAGGLMLVWPMDMIVCSDDATFSDPVVFFGANGVEYFVHPYEFGVRTAKDILFTGRPMSADEAFHRGMVQRVFPRGQLAQETLQLAAHIAQRPRFALAMAKRSVNMAEDAMGREHTLEATFGIHHLLHTHIRIAHPGAVAPPGMQENVRADLRRGPPPGLGRWSRSPAE